MAKKKAKVGINTVILAVAALLGIAAIIMLFVPQLSYQSATGLVKGDPLGGLKITFGYAEGDAQILDFSFGNFMTYVLALVGVVFAVLAMLGKLGKIAPLVAAVALIASGVMFFCAHSMMAVHVGDATGSVAEGIIKAVKDRYALGAGAIVGGILALLAGLGSAASIFVKK